MDKSYKIILQVMKAEIAKIKNAIDLEVERLDDPSFETGVLGVALFYIFYSKYSNDHHYLRKAENLIVKALSKMDPEHFQKNYATDTIDNHLAHFGRLIKFCRQKNLIAFDVDDYLLGLDSILFDLMKTKITAGNFDYQSGALAAGFYLISRVDDVDGIKEKLAHLLVQIDKMSLSDSDGGSYWKLITLQNRCYLGISHGSALIISFVCNLLELQIEVALCEDILRRACKFLIKQKADFGKGLFPHYIEDIEIGPKQFSLCYGDLGIGYALLRTGKLIKDSKIETTANQILSNCLERKKEDNLTFDASVTYGAAGLAITFEKIFKYTQDKKFLDATNYWSNNIAEYSIHDNQYAGYKSRVSNEANFGNLGFSWGIAGIGIVLMRSVDQRLPEISSLTLIA